MLSFVNYAMVTVIVLRKSRQSCELLTCVSLFLIFHYLKNDILHPNVETFIMKLQQRHTRRATYEKSNQEYEIKVYARDVDRQICVIEDEERIHKDKALQI